MLYVLLKVYCPEAWEPLCIRKRTLEGFLAGQGWCMTGLCCPGCCEKTVVPKWRWERAMEGLGRGSVTLGVFLCCSTARSFEMGAQTWSSLLRLAEGSSGLHLVMSGLTDVPGTWRSKIVLVWQAYYQLTDLPRFHLKILLYIYFYFSHKGDRNWTYVLCKSNVSS